MRLIALFAALCALVAGCGQASDRPTAAPAGTTEKVSQPEPPEAATTPPDIVLESAAGRQVGPRGSSCVVNRRAGKGLCTDMAAPRAKQLTVVEPGETVTIALDGARAVRDESCHARDLSCIGEAQVTPLGCPTRTLARIFLERGPETSWRVALEPGEYELHVFVYFQTDDGRSGDTSAALGLKVEPGGEPRIVPAGAPRRSCR